MSPFKIEMTGCTVANNTASNINSQGGGFSKPAVSCCFGNVTFRAMLPAPAEAASTPGTHSRRRIPALRGITPH